MIHRHPDNALLTEYTAGTLDTAPSISVSTHLCYCDQCNRTVDALAEIGGEILAGEQLSPLSDGLLGRVLQQIEAAPNAPRQTAEVSRAGQDLHDLHKLLPEYVLNLLPDEQLNWRFLSPSLRVANISVGDAAHELALHRISAGGKAPEHDHRGDEITVVLTGSFSDEDGIYHPGDFIVREPGDIHRPFAAQHEECICLSVLAAPISLTGLKRVFNPLLRFSPS